jgi:hypothetical protein
MGETTLWSACGRNGETFGLQCFAGVADAGCAHQVVKTGSGPKAARSPAFKWVNTALGNIKAAITGTYRAITRKHAPRYLAEFEYRFNRRYDLAAIIPRLTWAAVRLHLARAYASRNSRGLEPVRAARDADVARSTAETPQAACR